MRERVFRELEVAWSWLIAGRHRVEAYPPRARTRCRFHLSARLPRSVTRDSPMKRAVLGTAVPLSFPALLAIAACNRTPAEPAPSSSQNPTSIRPESSTPSTTAATAGSAKCIKPTPSAAPSIPPPAPASACPPDPEPNQKLGHADVTFPEAPNVPKVDVEIVKTPESIEKGLMYRRTMPEDAGMLFKLDSRREHTFWMH